MKPSDVPFAQAEVRIVYGIDHDGGQVVTTTYTADGVDDACPDLFTGVTMLELAKLDFLGRHGIVEMRHLDSGEDGNA